MTHDFDPGYCKPPYDDLCANYPDESVYPHADFRTEWGTGVSSGRLDGTARVLVIGQDPAQTENMVRRILMGVAGHRFQGFLFKLGMDRSYTMINTFLYSVYGQAGGTKHHNDHAIIDYRNQWLHAILSNNSIEAVIALGTLADEAWKDWKKTTASTSFSPTYAHITHPTAPRGSPRGARAADKEPVAELEYGTLCSQTQDQSSRFSPSPGAVWR